MSFRCLIHCAAANDCRGYLSTCSSCPLSSIWSGPLYPQMSASDEQRNFRSQYYEKMGFRCVEEKRSLEPLLREVPVDGARLAHVVRLHLVPGCYRPLVWRLLLKIQVSSTAPDSICNVYAPPAAA